jgi:predicted TIM-barrel fold metal-dependent hydrolase
VTEAPRAGTDEWRALVDEPIVDPDQRIVDAHHHLWPSGEGMRYGLAELLADVGSGHDVVRTVFVECQAAYRTDGPPELAPVGETGFVASAAADSGGLIGGIVAHADLRLPQLDDVLDAHLDAGRGLLRGVRHSLARGDRADGLTIPGRAPAGLSEDPAFRAGVRRLGARGLTYDTWLYHYQAGEFLDLARAVPYYLHVLDCFGADRCLFESNFPVDRFSLSYRTLGNAVKKMLHGATADERDAVFYRTATRVYRLDANG